MTQPTWSAPLDPSDRAPRYANAAIVAATQWDVTIDFQITTPAPGTPANTMNPELTVQRVARVVMSPTHAKVLANYLATTVEQWEGRFGQLAELDVLLPQALPAALEETGTDE
jgi:hypothetical protein